MENDRILLRRLDKDDLDDVARVHRAAFPGTALTRLGDEAVRRYYLWLMNDAEEMYGIGAFENGQLLGFLFGGIVEWDNMSQFLRQNRSLLLKGFIRQPWLIADPLFRNRIGRGIRALTRRSPQAPRAIPVGGTKRPFDAVSSAVLPTCQGKGIGRKLMREAENIARQNGFNVMTGWLETSNAQALHAWESIGWKKLVKNGRWNGVVENWLIPRQ
jgi:ribosomal protein S18 acetylase RimI-like enzyme